MKTFRKHLSFQAGEISPRFFGRSDTEIYNKGLATAENVLVFKQGGVAKRGGLEHVARTTGNKARVFTLQVSRTRYYTIFIHDFEMILIAPGARLLGNNLLLNGNFASSGANWNTTVTPGSSQIVFAPGSATLLPETENPETVVNGDFLQDATGWTIRVSHVQSTVTFLNGICTLTPRPQGTNYAGIAQPIITSNPGVVHTINIVGNFGNNISVKIG